MRICCQVLSISTIAPFEFRDIGRELNHAIKASGIENGFILVRSRHTTAAITCTEPDPAVHRDCLTILNDLLPLSRNYEHSYEGNVNARAHQAEMLGFGHSTWAVVRNGIIDLGRWQKVYLVELFTPMKRDIDVVVVGE